MTDRTLREKITALEIWQGDDGRTSLVSLASVLAILDAQTEQPASSAAPRDNTALVEAVCHDDQMVVWSSEIMGDLCEWLDFDDYDDKLDAYAAVKSTIRSIVHTTLASRITEVKT